MKTPLIDHPLFLQIRREHEHIKALLGQFDADKTNLPLLREIYEKAELEHHNKEEHLLFSHLLSFESVNGGGPLCMLYMDDYVINHPITACKKLTGHEPVIGAHLTDFFESGSAMRIPINEHLSGKTVLSFLIESFYDLSEARRTELFKFYFKLQTNHMEKEENCFFYVCANHLTTSSADEIYKKWIKKGEEK